jgi:hypothetical protein
MKIDTSKYDDLQNVIKKSHEWNDLPKRNNYMKSKMPISSAHCSLKLQRMGQTHQGGDSYHEAPKGLCDEILKIISKDPIIINQAIENLEKKSKEALIACKVNAQTFLKQIEEVENEN